MSQNPSATIPKISVTSYHATNSKYNNILGEQTTTQKSTRWNTSHTSHILTASFRRGHNKPSAEHTGEHSKCCARCHNGRLGGERISAPIRTCKHSHLLHSQPFCFVLLVGRFVRLHHICCLRLHPSCLAMRRQCACHCPISHNRRPPLRVVNRLPRWRLAAWRRAQRNPHLQRTFSAGTMVAVGNRGQPSRNGTVSIGCWTRATAFRVWRVRVARNRARIAATSRSSSTRCRWCTSVAATVRSAARQPQRRRPMGTTAAAATPPAAAAAVWPTILHIRSTMPSSLWVLWLLRWIIQRMFYNLYMLLVFFRWNSSVSMRKSNSPWCIAGCRCRRAFRHHRFRPFPIRTRRTRTNAPGYVSKRRRMLS